MEIKDFVSGENGKFLLLAFALLVVSLIVVLAMNAGMYGNSGLFLEGKSTYTSPNQMIEEGIDYNILIDTEFGKIYVDLYETLAPESVNSILFLVNERYYEGLLIHKVVKDFVIQTGDAKGDGTGNPGYEVVGENMVPFKDFDIGMANASQFFVVMPNSDKSLLNGYYSVVGRVTKGFAILESIQKAEVDENYRPLNDITINSIQIQES